MGRTIPLVVSPQQRVMKTSRYRASPKPSVTSKSRFCYLLHFILFLCTLRLAHRSNFECMQSYYRQTQVATTKEEIIRAISSIPLSNDQGPTLIEVKVARGSRKDLGRYVHTGCNTYLTSSSFSPLPSITALLKN